jgi:hypothetical protein
VIVIFFFEEATTVSPKNLVFIAPLAHVPESLKPLYRLLSVIRNH